MSLVSWALFFAMFLGGGPKQTQANPKPTQIKPTPTQSKITPNQSQHKANPSQPKANPNRTKAKHKQPQSKPHPIQSPPKANLIQSKKHRTPTPNPDCQEHTPPYSSAPQGLKSMCFHTNLQDFLCNILRYVGIPSTCSGNSHTLDCTAS